MIEYRVKQFSDSDRDIFISYLNRVEAWKIRCKNLHWAAEHKDIHEYLDDLYEDLISYQDKIAETFMGVLGSMGPLDINPEFCDKSEPIDLLEDIINKTAVEFYHDIPEDVVFKGISSEVESMLQKLENYKYLFNLCK